MSRRACRLFRNAGLFAGLFEFGDDRVGDVGAAVEYDALIHDYGELLLVGDGPHGEVDFLEERLHEPSFFLGELLALRLVDFGFFLVFWFSYPNQTLNFTACFAVQKQTFFDSPRWLGHIKMTDGMISAA